MRLFHRYVSYRKLALFAGEALLLYACILAGMTYPWVWGTEQWVQGTIASAVVVLLLIPVLALSELYDWRVSADRRERNWKLFVACGAALIVLAIVVKALQLLGLAALVQFPSTLDPGITTRLILVVLGTFLVLAVWRAFFHWAIGRWKFHERLLVLGSGTAGRTLAREIHERRDTGFELVGFYLGDGADGAPRELPSVPFPVVRGDAESLYDVARRMRVHRVVVAMEDRRKRLPTEELLRCRMEGIPVEEWLSLYERITGKIAVESLHPSHLIFSEGFRKSRFVLATKRALDLTVSAAGLLVTAPIMIASAIAIRLDSRGPVFIRQKRIGKDGREFTLFKFRTMRADAERDTGPVWARVNDERITRTGVWLRKSRIDELPQLWNVLRGEMSFVGPRPERPFFVEELEGRVRLYRQRLTVKPGITGWAQVNYRYGSSLEDAVVKLQYDLYYIKNMSVLFDLMVLGRTIGVVILRKGAV
ncbi:MAG TPA: TIGR03013 family XrtA/PEP-CTERM system glycosyltransferase [Planctomycetota bacterium]|jgi:sugar transferase (PEP-CTERM system associated)|nr:TIGR03013 family XrtA/PEP-CTERM system glycosyltransferase [Planctomycetota bacterium]